MTRHNWTPEEEAIVREQWPDLAIPVRQIAERVGHSENAVHQRAMKLGAVRPNPTHPSEETRATRQTAILRFLTEAARAGRKTPGNVEIAAAAGITLHEARRSLEGLIRIGAVELVRPTPNSRFFRIGDMETGIAKTGTQPKPKADGRPPVRAIMATPKPAPAPARKPRSVLATPAPLFIPPAKPVAAHDRAAELRAIEEAIAAGKVRRMPTAYVEAVRGATPLQVASWEPGMSKAALNYKQTQARRRAQRRSLTSARK